MTTSCHESQSWHLRCPPNPGKFINFARLDSLIIRVNRVATALGYGCLEVHSSESLRHWQEHAEHGTASAPRRQVVLGADASVVSFDNRPHDRETHAEPLLFGGEE